MFYGFLESFLKTLPLAYKRLAQVLTRLLWIG